MPVAQDLTLTTPEHEALDALYRTLPPVVLSRATALIRERGVRSVEWALRGEIIVAHIQASRVYTAQLGFANGSVFPSCTCDTDADAICSHAAALVIALLKSATTGDRNDPFPAASGGTEPPSLASLVREKTGKPLSVVAMRFINTVEPWWQRQHQEVETSALAIACGEAGYWGYGRVALHPAGLPPQDGWEFLAGVVSAAYTARMRVPAGITECLDPSLLQNLADRWKRHQEVEHWTDTLSLWDEPETEETRTAPELRLLLHPSGAIIEIKHPGDTTFGKASQKSLKQLAGRPRYGQPATELSVGSSLVLKAVLDEWGGLRSPEAPALSDSLTRSLSQLISSRELCNAHVVTLGDETLIHSEEPLRWELQEPKDGNGDYLLRLLTNDGAPVPAPLAILPGNPRRYVTSEVIYPVACFPAHLEGSRWPVRIPAAAIESKAGVSALGKLGVPVPKRLAGKVRLVTASIDVHCRVHRPPGSAEYLQISARATFGKDAQSSDWHGERWVARHLWADSLPREKEALVQIDRSPMAAAADWLRQMPMKQSLNSQGSVWMEQRISGKDWPEQFTAWLDRRPRELSVELDAELASLRDGRVAGIVRLDVEESKTGIDWFDLTVALELTDHTLSPEEVDLLMKARGKWVRLTGKGWRKLDFTLTDQQEQELAELGLGAHQLTGEKQRLHALQLSSLTKKNHSLLPADRAVQVQRRLEEIQTRVAPDVPAAITAALRPYQTEGFHFLAYLSTNRFGGVLADDMGLGKTLQALTWIAWLRATQNLTEPVLVVCPKSVQDNWRTEAARFLPDLPVEVWNRGAAGTTPPGKGGGLLVIHYAQLRAHEDTLCAIHWGAVILDEAQAIKNPTSQSAKAACSLNAKHRLALTGTPIENRLLDLWSIFAFAMPGILGNRASFTRQFDAKEDRLARRRLAARTKPFLLRRTKKEVAGDLPDRVEEDLVIELEGVQATLYQAELKRARAQLLKAETGSQLDKLRFNILTSLLRLRQICCDPRLLGLDEPAAASSAGPEPGKRRKPAADAAGSAKVAALMELLEPLMEEGQKVLVFSQFTGMLDLIEAEIARQEWTTFKLTGQTENRGPLVQEFQEFGGAAVFLISLKAGGFGLNLTAASYVVLFDPWWNPAVEAQAIDRTHRIGQKQTVFAYRLIVKDSIEEKIRHLQKQKGDLARELLGEESFAKALTLSDFQFLLGEE